MLLQTRRFCFQAGERFQWMPLSTARGAGNERAVADRLCDAVEFFRLRQYQACVYGGTRFAESEIVGPHQAQTQKTEIAHGAGGRSNIERITAPHQDDAKTILFFIDQHWG